MRSKKQVKQNAALSLFLAGVLISSIAAAADVSVKIENLKSNEGNVRVALFNTAADFPKKLFKGEVTEAKQGTVTVVFKGIPEGNYAFSAFQDINGNEKLDTNAVGKPTEPYGFSNNARGLFGPPSFDDAVVKVQAGDNSIEVKVK